MKAGWETKKLGDVCEIISGSTPLKSKKEYWEEGEIPWFTIEDIREQGRVIRKTKQKITEYALKNTSIKMLPAETILLCCTASIGEFAITEIPLTTNQQFNGLIVRDRKYILPKYIYYISATLRSDLIRISGKTTIDFVPKSRLQDVSFSVPPLPEQRRIVAILDEAFAGIAAAKESAEQNLKNAKEVFEAYSQIIFTNACKNANEIKLGDANLVEILDGDRGKNYPKKEDFYTNGYCLFLSTKNVKQNGFLFEETIYISEDKHKKMRNGKLERNDVVMTTRGTIGNLGLYSHDMLFNNIRINSGMLIFRPNINKILPEYLFKILGSKIIQEQIIKNTSGAAQPQLPIKTLSKFTVPVPKSLSEQRQVVSQLDNLSAETSVLESIYQQKLSNLEELKKSLLQQAFSGAL